MKARWNANQVDAMELWAAAAYNFSDVADMYVDEPNIDAVELEPMRVAEANPLEVNDEIDNAGQIQDVEDMIE